MLFQDRIDAGNKLALELKKHQFQNPMIVALPRGGVPVAKAVAIALHAPLEVLIVRKIGAPHHPELGVGAITENGHALFNERLMHRLHLSFDSLEDTIQRETIELQRRIKTFRSGRPFPSVKGRNVILIDDGLATGFTAAVAVKFLRANGAHRIILAVPVGASDSVRFLEQHADQVICLQTPNPFYGVGEWYRDFDQTTDHEVTSILTNPPSKEGAA